MNDSNLKCRGRDNCSSPVSIACNCGVPLIFLCDGCLSRHVHKLGNHRLINLNQAKQLLNGSNMYDHYEESYIKYLQIKSDFLAYIRDLKEFKTKVTSFKLEIFDQIEKMFDSKLEKIDSAIESTYIQLYELNKESDNQIVQRYEDQGLGGLVHDYIYNMNLNVNNIREVISDIIILETRDSAPIQAYSQSSNVLPIYIEELRELIQYQAQRSDEIENRLNQLQQGSQLIESSFRQQEARSDKSFKELENNIRDVYDTLEMLKSYPNIIAKQTSDNLQEIQQLFNEKYSSIDNEINKIKQLTAQIEQTQAEDRVRDVIQSQGQSVQTIPNLRKEEIKKIPDHREVKLPKNNQPQGLTQSPASTLKSNSEQKHQEKIQVNEYSLNLDYESFEFSSTAKNSNPTFYPPPSTGIESSNTMLHSAHSNPLDYACRGYQYSKQYEDQIHPDSWQTYKHYREGIEDYEDIEDHELEECYYKDYEHEDLYPGLKASQIYVIHPDQGQQSRRNKKRDKKAIIDPYDERQADLNIKKKKNRRKR